MVHNMLFIVQITLSILLVALVLLQRANTDASGAFGSDGGQGVSLKKRGAEKILHYSTIVTALFFVFSLATPLILR